VTVKTRTHTTNKLIVLLLIFSILYVYPHSKHCLYRRDDSVVHFG